jgi:transcriptional regulator
MYIPKHTAMLEIDKQLAFMRVNSFATLVSMVNGELFATHVPVRSTHDEQSGAVSLAFHLAKANPHAQALANDAALLVIFNGPHAYISPSNYEQRDVPTWNYVAVHAYGQAQVIDDAAGKLALLADVIGHYEAAFQAEWDAMPETYRSGMLAGIRAFRVAVTRIEGKEKLSQNRSPVDQERVAEWLGDHAHETPRAVGELMKKKLAARDAS